VPPHFRHFTPLALRSTCTPHVTSEQAVQRQAGIARQGVPSSFVRAQSGTRQRRSRVLGGKASIRPSDTPNYNRATGILLPCAADHRIGAVPRRARDDRKKERASRGARVLRFADEGFSGGDRHCLGRPGQRARAPVTQGLRSCAVVAGLRSCAVVAEPRSCAVAAEPRSCAVAAEPRNCAAVAEPRNCAAVAGPRSCAVVAGVRSCVAVGARRRCVGSRGCRRFR
jgi:hypothetical protein